MQAGAGLSPGLGLNEGTGLCGWGSQVRLLGASKAHECPQAPAWLFCTAAPGKERPWRR